MARDADVMSIGVRTARRRIDDGRRSARSSTGVLPADGRSDRRADAGTDLSRAAARNGGSWSSASSRCTAVDGGQFFRSQLARFVAFVSAASFLGFSLILRLVLKYLDPSKAVPRRVRDALNNLAEGLLILDTKENILLANSAFASIVGD